MIYRKSECCITPETNGSEIFETEGGCMKDRCDLPKRKTNYEDNCTDTDVMRRLSELRFAQIDLNLYLDTHPCDEEALKMFKKVSKTLESLRYDYTRKYGPLKASDSSEDTPFEWASPQFKWPWEK